MLQRIAPSLFQGTTGEPVTIAAVSQSNNGVEAATFRYGTTQLTPRQVQGHPGCEFNVRAGTETFGALVVFDPASPNARYELFEEDDNGILQPLQVIARPLTGPIVQFQIAAIPMPMALPLPPPGPGLAASIEKTARRSAKKAVKRTARKAAKKTAKKVTAAATKKKAAKATKKTSKKTAKRTAKKAAKRKIAKRRPR